MTLSYDLLIALDSAQCRLPRRCAPVLKGVGPLGGQALGAAHDPRDRTVRRRKPSPFETGNCL